MQELEQRAKEHYKFLMLVGDLETFLPKCSFDWNKDKKRFIPVYEENELIINNPDLETEEDEDDDLYTL